MPIATPEVYAEMLNRARDGKFAYPAINVTSSQTITAALQGFAEAESDGILQVSVGGAEYGSGSTIKNRVTGSLAPTATRQLERPMRTPSSATDMTSVRSLATSAWAEVPRNRR